MAGTSYSLDSAEEICLRILVAAPVFVAKQFHFHFICWAQVFAYYFFSYIAAYIFSIIARLLSLGFFLFWFE